MVDVLRIKVNGWYEFIFSISVMPSQFSNIIYLVGKVGQRGTPLEPSMRTLL